GVLGGLILIVWTAVKWSTKASIVAWKTESVTTLPGAEVFPAFSPDAKRIVFVWAGSPAGQADVYWKSREGGEPMRLTNDAATECYPAWSPDGRWIAFLHCASGALEGYISVTAPIYVIPSSGGEKRKIAEVRSATNRYLPQLAWTPDSK